MKRTALIIGLTLLSQISWAQLAPPRTKAVSALKVLVDRQAAARRSMPQDLASGADISYICTAIIFDDWGQKVFESIMSVPQAQDAEVIASYLAVRDEFSRSFKLVLRVRQDLPQAIRIVNAELRKNMKLAVVPENLNFESFSSQERNYFNSLSTCLDAEYILAVNNAAAPLIDDTVVDGVEVGAADIADEASVGIVIGSGGDAGGRPGIAPGGNVQFVTIEDISADYKKKQSYSEWIQAVINVR